MALKINGKTFVSNIPPTGPQSASLPATQLTRNRLVEPDANVIGVTPSENRTHSTGVPPLITGINLGFGGLKASLARPSGGPLGPHATAKVPPAAGMLSVTDSSDLPPSGADPAKKTKATLGNLRRVAAELNEASDQLAQPVRDLEAVLKGLNLGVAAWHQIAKGDDDDEWWDRGIGYSRIRGNWGIALRTRRGNFRDDETTEEVWPFNEAPRWMRIEGSGKLPELLDALVKQAEETISKIKVQTARAADFATALLGSGEANQPEAR